jgi:hypothetical protein
VRDFKGMDHRRLAVDPTDSDIQASSPEIWRKTIFGGEGGCWRGKWGGLFWATSLEKIFGGTTTLAAAKGRLIRCTVPRSTANCLAMHAHPVARSRQAYLNSLRHLRSSLPRRYHPTDSNCERIQSEHFLDFMKQRHSPLLRSVPPV